MSNKTTTMTAGRPGQVALAEVLSLVSRYGSYRQVGPTSSHGRCRFECLINGMIVSFSYTPKDGVRGVSVGQPAPKRQGPGGRYVKSLSSGIAKALYRKGIVSISLLNPTTKVPQRSIRLRIEITYDVLSLIPVIIFTVAPGCTCFQDGVTFISATDQAYSMADSALAGDLPPVILLDWLQDQDPRITGAIEQWHPGCFVRVN